MSDVRAWLAGIGLGQYADAFEANDVEMDLLKEVDDQVLKDIGVTSAGHRLRIRNAIAKLARASHIQANSNGAVATPDVAAASGERRQLTVMFCDLVGSTALSEKLDPEELRGLLHAYRTLYGDVISRYDGFVARYVGDGILTYFGWPTAHEEDAERAMRAALEIVHTVKRASSTEDLSVRIGIATGPVVVGEATGVGDQSKLAVGRTPNLAARLQGLATADQIVIASSTRRLVGRAFELTDLGEHDLKGIAEPVHAWRVERALVTESRFDAHRGGNTLTPLVGRGAELDLLLSRWSQANDGEGQVVLLSGEPGIGKSRILSALRERLEAQGVQALRFQCSPYYVNSAFWPFIDNFERTLKFARDETAEAKLDQLEALVVTHYGRPLADVRFVASILSIPCEARYGALAMTPQKHKDETLRTLVDLTEAAARQQPSVMLFEDAHWADPTTLEVLDLLIDRVKTVPLLVVLTHRPEFQSRWSEQGHVGALNLSKLTRTQSATMVSTLAGGKALPAALLGQILTRTDGVPLFVEELTKSILESGALKDAGDHYAYAGSARAVTIPGTLRDSLMARLDRFAPVKEMAQIGAAIGREFSYELIAAVAPLPQAQLYDALAQLSQSGLAFRRGTPPDAVYVFKHALVQDAAYDSLLKSRRQELHGKIARVIEARFPNIKTTEPEVLAHHLTAADLAEAAIPLWQAAGELAFKRLVLTEAISHFNQGLELVATVSWSPERDAIELGLRSLLGTAWLALEGWATPEVWTSLHPWPTTPDRDAPRDNAASHVAELLARHWTEAGQIEKAAGLWGKAGQRSAQRSALVEAAEQLQRALELITTLPGTPELRREEIKLQVALITPLLPIKGYAAPETKAAVERARLLIEQAEALGEPPEDPLLLLSVLYGFWVANYVAFNGDVMRELAAQFLTLAGRQGTTTPLMIGHRLMGVTSLVTGDLAESRAHFDQAIALYNPVEHRSLQTRFGQDIRVASLSLRSWAQCVLGFCRAALADAERALKDAREMGQTGFRLRASKDFSILSSAAAATLMYALLVTSITHVICGNYAAANALVDELISLTDQTGSLFWGAWGIMQRGCVLALTGKASGAVQTITSGVTAWRSTGSTAMMPFYLSYLARAHAEHGQFDDATRCIGEAMTAMETTKEKWCEAEVNRIAGEIALLSPEPDGAKAEAYFERALAVAREQQAKSWELRTSTSLARVWQSQGKRRDAYELLAPVYGWFTEGFDTKDLQDAKALLAGLG